MRTSRCNQGTAWVAPIRYLSALISFAMIRHNCHLRIENNLAHFESASYIHNPKQHICLKVLCALLAMSSADSMMASEQTAPLKWGNKILILSFHIGQKISWPSANPEGLHTVGRNVDPPKKLKRNKKLLCLLGIGGAYVSIRWRWACVWSFVFHWQSKYSTQL